MPNDLRGHLCDGLTHIFTRFDLYNKQVYFNGNSWDKLNTDFANWCLDKKLVQEDFLRNLVHLRIMQIGRYMYGQTQRETSQWPDHVSSPEALAYAIKHNVFTTKELSQIRFDHDDTAETFMKEKVDYLDAEVLAQLLNREPFDPNYVEPISIGADNGP